MKESKVAGRIAVHVPDHPKANNRGYIIRARYVMERHLGRYLTGEEHVHHKDGDYANDVIENLQVLSRSEHAKAHPDNLGNTSRLNYALIKKLRLEGLGYKRIVKRTGYARSSIRSACYSMGI